MQLELRLHGEIADGARAPVTLDMQSDVWRWRSGCVCLLEPLPDSDAFELIQLSLGLLRTLQLSWASAEQDHTVVHSTLQSRVWWKIIKLSCVGTGINPCLLYLHSLPPIWSSRNSHMILCLDYVLLCSEFPLIRSEMPKPSLICPQGREEGEVNIGERLYF